MARSVDDLVFGAGVELDGYTVKSTSRSRISTRVANDPPTVWDIEAAFGSASEVGEGFVGLFNPSGAGTSLYLCAFDGTNWWVQALAAATT